MQQENPPSSAPCEVGNSPRQPISTHLSKSSIRQVFTGHRGTRSLIRSCHPLSQLIRHPIELTRTDPPSDPIQQFDPARNLVLFSQSFGDQSVFHEITAFLVVRPKVGADEGNPFRVFFQIRRDPTKQELESIVISLVGGLFATQTRSYHWTMISLPLVPPYNTPTTTHSSQIGSLPNFPLPSSFHFLVSCK